MVVKFQSNASKQGALFAQSCITALEQSGWEIIETKYKVPFIGVEIDIIANNAHGIAFPFECKGSWAVERPGSRRTDTLKKAIGNGALFLGSEEAQIMVPIVLLTSHLPEQGSGLEMLQTAMRLGYFLDVLLDRDGIALQWYCNANESDIQKRLASRRPCALAQARTTA